ncbi:MAG: ribose-5-phosphate isomerase RpiA [Anaerolineae bacterium]
MAVTLEELKRQAAEKAVEQIGSGMVVGLGTGSTAVHAVRALGLLLQKGILHDIIGIPTSEVTASEARRWRIPLSSLDEHPQIDVTIDGADEIAPDLNLIKGLGGALLREKIVAAASRRMIVVADHSKRVARLGTRAPVPVEVIPFARQPVAAHLESLGARVVERVREGQRFITDEGNIILDCHFEAIPHPAELARAIREQPGVVEHGLFLGLATAAIVAAPSGINILHRSP